MVMRVYIPSLPWSASDAVLIVVTRKSIAESSGMSMSYVPVIAGVLSFTSVGKIVIILVIRCDVDM